eukprot:2044242-Karenia_brevis.AAC.1
MADLIRHFNFPELCLNTTHISCMHECSKAYISASCVVDVHSIDCENHDLYIAIDGSGGSQLDADTKGPASWAVALFSLDAQQQSYFHGH